MHRLELPAPLLSGLLFLITALITLGAVAFGVSTGNEDIFVLLPLTVLYFAVCGFTRTSITVFGLKIFWVLAFTILNKSFSNGASDSLFYYDFGAWEARSAANQTSGLRVLLGSNVMNEISTFIQSGVHLSYLSINLLFAAPLMFLLNLKQKLMDQRLWLMGWLLLPTLALWGSGISKEALIAPAVLLSVTAFSYWHSGETRRYALAIIAATTLAAFIRPHIILVLLAPHFLLIIAGSLRGFGRSWLIPKMAPLVLVLTLAGAALGIQFAAGDLSVEAIANSAEAVSSANTYGALAFTPSPVERFFALFQPLPWRINGALALLFGLEALVIIFMALRVLAWRRYVAPGLLVAALLAIVVWTAIYGTTGNIGLLVRMKQQALPFLLFAFAYVTLERRKQLAEWNNPSPPVSPA